MWVTTSRMVWLASRGTSKTWKAPSLPPRQTETLRVVAKVSGYPLVVQVLRMVRIGEKVPALHQQAGELADERGAKKAQAKQDRRQRERKDQESPAHPAQRSGALPVEKLARVERAGGEALRHLADARLGDADRALQARARPQPPVARERGATERGREQGERDRPQRVEARELRRERGGERRRQREARRAAEQEEVGHRERRGPFLQELDAGVDHRGAKEQDDAHRQDRSFQQRMPGKREAQCRAGDEGGQRDHLARKPRGAPLRGGAPRRADAAEVEERRHQACGREQRRQRERRLAKRRVSLDGERGDEQALPRAAQRGEQDY